MPTKPVERAAGRFRSGIVELKVISGADRVVSDLSQFFSDTTLSVSSLSSYNCTQILDLLPAAIYLTDASGTLLYFNSTAAELWGREPIRGSERWCGAWRLYTKDGSPLAVDQCPMAIALKTKRPVRGIEAVIERPDGIRVPVIPFPTPIFDANGEMIGAINMIVDISDRKRAESRISYLADHDALTGLRNRASMRSWVDGLIAGDAGRRQQFALLALDLRRFRNVKDVYGHTVAETLLRDFSRLLRSAARGAAMARFGFDEFLVLVDGRDAEAEAAQFHNRLTALLADDGTAGQGPFRMEVAIGGAVYPRDGLDFDTLFSRAGAALFRVKKSRHHDDPVFRQPDRYADPGNPGDLARSRQRLAQQEARTALSAEIRHAWRSAWIRGAGALAPSDPRHDPAGHLHPSGRRKRADPAAR
jgi:diguanylate cyclase (GGDEF)-like protein/PAS domain S-box-containing protein